MWALTNTTPYLAERGWHVDQDGRTHWLVVVKATYDIATDGKTTLTREENQVLPALEPEYLGDPGVSSLKYESDLSGPKPATDVVVHGHAYAPGGKPAAEVTVGLSVGDHKKVLRVRGDRRWTRGVLGVDAGSPQPFVKLSLSYERSHGGFDATDADVKKQKMDPLNPVGTGVASRKENLVGKPVANIELLGSPDKAAGLGPIASHWSPRRELAGTYDEAWVKNRRPLLPKDFDPRHFNCAPADQQFAPHLRGGERIGLANLTPSGSLAVAIPKVALAFTTHLGARREEHRATLQTVILEPDFPRLIAVWQTSLPCPQPELLDKTVIREKRFV